MENKTVFKLTKKDFEVTWFSGTGPGGQSRNKNAKCCRIKHIATGIIKTGQSHKERKSNQKEAFEAIAKDPRFLSWVNLRLSEIEKGKTIEEEVDEMMKEENLKIEVKNKEGKWIDEQ